MSRLDTAIIILTNLKTHIGNKIAESAAAATASDLTRAIAMLDEEITYTVNEKARAQSEKEASKKNTWAPRDKRFETLHALENEVTALSTALTTARTTYHSQLEAARAESAAANQAAAQERIRIGYATAISTLTALQTEFIAKLGEAAIKISNGEFPAAITLLDALQARYEADCRTANDAFDLLHPPVGFDVSQLTALKLAGDSLQGQIAGLRGRAQEGIAHAVAAAANPVEVAIAYRDAIRILEELQSHLSAQIHAATQKRNENNFASAIALLEAAHVKYQADLQAANTRFNTGYAPAGFDVSELEALKRAVAALLEQIVTAKRRAQEAHDTTASAAHHAFQAAEQQIAASAIPEDPEARFGIALLRLKGLQAQKHEIIDELLAGVIQQIEKLKREGKESTTELTAALDNTYLRLTGRLDSTVYNDGAKTMQGVPSANLQVLGGFMLALSITIAILGLLFVPPLAGAVIAAGIIAEASATAAVTTAFALPSVACLATSIGMFAANRKRGLCKEMAQLDEGLLSQGVIYTAPGA